MSEYAVVESMSLNKILVALLDEHGSLSVSTDKFVNATFENKELVADYDENNLTFTFSLRSKNEQQ